MTKAYILFSWRRGAASYLHVTGGSVASREQASVKCVGEAKTIVGKEAYPKLLDN